MFVNFIEKSLSKIFLSLNHFEDIHKYTI